MKKKKLVKYWYLTLDWMTIWKRPCSWFCAGLVLSNRLELPAGPHAGLPGTYPEDSSPVPLKTRGLRLCSDLLEPSLELLPLVGVCAAPAGNRAAHDQAEVVLVGVNAAALVELELAFAPEVVDIQRDVLVEPHTLSEVAEVACGPSWGPDMPEATVVAPPALSGCGIRFA